MDVTIREFEPSDQAFVTDMQCAALFVPSGEAPPDREILAVPGIARYHAGLGEREGDVSVDARNPAIRLYRRMGFETVRREGEHAIVMLREGS